MRWPGTLCKDLDEGTVGSWCPRTRSMYVGGDTDDAYDDDWPSLMLACPDDLFSSEEEPA